MIGRFVMRRTTAAPRQHQRRHLAATIGGGVGRKRARTAKYEYRLGCAWDDDTLLVSILNGDEVNVGIAFEADSYDNAFARALAISKDVADEAGHLSEGVTVSLTEFGGLAEIGIDAD
jgi:hypothetical protein